MTSHITEGLCSKAAGLGLGWGTGNLRLIRATWLIQSSCTGLVQQWKCSPTDDAKAAETVAGASSEYLEVIKVYGEKYLT